MSRREAACTRIPVHLQPRIILPLSSYLVFSSYKIIRWHMADSVLNSTRSLSLRYRMHRQRANAYTHAPTHCISLQIQAIDWSGDVSKVGGASTPNRLNKSSHFGFHFDWIDCCLTHDHNISHISQFEWYALNSLGSLNIVPLLSLVFSFSFSLSLRLIRLYIASIS